MKYTEFSNKKPSVAEGSVTPNVTVNKVHDDGHEKEWHVFRGKEMIGYVIKNQPDTAEDLYIAYGHGPGRAFVEEFRGLKSAVNYITSLKEGVAEGNDKNVVVKFSAREYAAMSPEQKAKKQQEWQQLKQQAKRQLKNFTLVDTDKKQGVAEGSLSEVDRRGFLRGLGAAALGAAGIGAATNAQARATPEWMQLYGKAKSKFEAGYDVAQVARALGVSGPNNGMTGPLGGEWGAINKAAQDTGRQSSAATTTSAQPTQQPGLSAQQTNTKADQNAKIHTQAVIFAGSNPEFKKEYDRLSQFHDKATNNLRNGLLHSKLSDNPDIAQRQRNELLRQLKYLDQEFEQKTVELLKFYKAPINEQAVAEATGDPKFDAMMRGIKKGTAKQRTADRRAERAASQAQAKAAFGNMFGTSGESPADKLSIRKDVKEVSDQTLINYLTKVDADSQKHPSDPTKRSPEKASRSVTGFSRAFNKLDARKATELAPRVGESTEEDRQRYEQAARDVVKGADPDHIARVRKLDPETLRSQVNHAWERVNSGEYKLNRPNLKETNLESVVNAQQGGMPLADVNEARESCPECGGPMFPALVLGEKQDACYYKVKSRYKVWPSAYASGALVQCRKKGAANWGNKGK
jgi:hypothetical protein